jgi:hypothetical protein
MSTSKETFSSTGNVITGGGNLEVFMAESRVVVSTQIAYLMKTSGNCTTVPWLEGLDRRRPAVEVTQYSFLPHV